MVIAFYGKPLIKVGDKPKGFIFLLKFKEEVLFMCLKNYQPVSEYNSPCGSCPEYLNSCMPVILDGFIFGECDLCYCEWCSCYEECMNGGSGYEVTEL